MKQILRNVMGAAALAVGMLASPAQASVVIAGTRVIFPSQEREVTIKLTNQGDTPSLVQAWLDNGDVNEIPEKIKVPFTLTPAIFRLDPGKGQTLRLIYTKEPLAKDKESLFWLNVLEVPPKVEKTDAEANSLQLAFRTRIKVIFRPAGLPGKAEQAPAQVRWEIARDASGKGYALKATNPTPYMVNLGAVSLKMGGKVFDAGDGFVKPGESELFPIKDLSSSPASNAEVEYSSINDWGGSVQGTLPISSTGG